VAEHRCRALAIAPNPEFAPPTLLSAADVERPSAPVQVVSTTVAQHPGNLSINVSGERPRRDGGKGHQADDRRKYRAHRSLEAGIPHRTGADLGPLSKLGSRAAVSASSTSWKVQAGRELRSLARGPCDKNVS
jgi:hypothetical protein